MRNWFKQPDPTPAVIDEVFRTVPKTLSEELCRRDNFFHSCWMQLKVMRPDLMEEMTKIEIIVSGITAPKKESEDGNEEPHDIIL